MYTCFEMYHRIHGSRTGRKPGYKPKSWETQEVGASRDM
jgi:hypothetical protein